MNWIDFLIAILLTGYVIVALFMSLIILMQRSKQEGLGAAFGGGFTDSVWGAQTSQVLVKATVVFATCFFLFSICLDRLYSTRANLSHEESPVQKALLAAPPVQANAAHPGLTTGSNVVPVPVAPNH